MKKILIINAHWYNHGDEAALRAMIDELQNEIGDVVITVCLLAGGEYFPCGENLKLLDGELPAGNRIKWVDYVLRYLSKGKLGIKSKSKQFIETVKESNLVIHAPGGPSIGDIYIDTEKYYLARLLMVKRLNRPYVFYAPSMGPFEKKTRSDRIRKRVINGAEFIAVREPQSAEYLRKYGIRKMITVTRDSAFQHPIDTDDCLRKFDNYNELKQFISRYDRVVGVTITDLQWNPKYQNNTELKNRIQETFELFISYLNEEGYGVVFIPQLFAGLNDYDYMSTFVRDNCFIITDREEYDCYFQQYVISQLFLVVGMRYHSNIFAAKMKTPFISVSYEQKMSGFMRSAGLDKYCISIDNLNSDILCEKLNTVVSEYDKYKAYLNDKSIVWMAEAQQTTKMVANLIKNSKQKTLDKKEML